MNLLPGFPDIEDVGMALFAPLADTTTWTGDDLEYDTPTITVLRIGGEDDYVSDYPIVEVACFHNTYNEARKLAEDARQLALSMSGKSVVTDDHPAGVLIDKANTTEAPVRVAYDNPSLRRKVITLRFVLRRPRT